MFMPFGCQTLANPAYNSIWAHKCTVAVTSAIRQSAKGEPSQQQVVDCMILSQAVVFGACPSGIAGLTCEFA